MSRKKEIPKIKVHVYGLYKTKVGHSDCLHLVTGIKGSFNTNREITGFIFYENGAMMCMFDMYESGFLEEVGNIYDNNSPYAITLNVKGDQFGPDYIYYKVHVKKRSYSLFRVNSITKTIELYDSLNTTWIGSIYQSIYEVYGGVYISIEELSTGQVKKELITEELLK